MNARRWLIGCFLLFAGCQSAPITLATTTSTQDTGLLDVLVPMFEAETGIKVKVVAVGTGQALEIARRGDADVLLVHAPEAEKKFMDEGHGESRQPVMHNDFILVGPSDDPAGIRGMTKVAEAFAAIQAKSATFVSRGDDSGTHKKELAIWKEAQLDPKGGWYKKAGNGMAAVLRIADEFNAYTLTDRGTYLSIRDNLRLPILLEGDPLLFNPYSVIVVNPAKHPQLNPVAARRFAEFLRKDSTRKTIEEFGRDQYGQSLFTPD